MRPAPDIFSLERFGFRDWRRMVELTLMEESMRTCSNRTNSQIRRRVTNFEVDRKENVAKTTYRLTELLLKGKVGHQ